MKTRLHLVKSGVDHLELLVDDETAADLVADEAHKHDIKPVIGQHLGQENTPRHYVVLHGPVDDTMKFLKQDPNFDLVKDCNVIPTGANESIAPSVR